VAAAGCHLYRTDHGFILQARWSLEWSDGGCVPVKGNEGPCEVCSDGLVRPAAQTLVDKPEILPWRTRLKARIGPRLIRDEEFGRQMELGEAAATPVIDSKHLPPPPAMPRATPTAKSPAPRSAIPAAESPEVPSPTPAVTPAAMAPALLPAPSPPTPSEAVTRKKTRLEATTDSHLPKATRSRSEPKRPDLVME
jgi:hypothetical protein